MTAHRLKRGEYLKIALFEPHTTVDGIVLTPKATRTRVWFETTPELAW